MIPRVVDYLFEKTGKDLTNEYIFKVAFVQIYQVCVCVCVCVCVRVRVCVRLRATRCQVCVHLRVARTNL